mgnify:CR=1 FL=1
MWNRIQDSLRENIIKDQASNFVKEKSTHN